MPGDDFPAEEIHDIDQDSLGFLWLATDMGAIRYDGYRFERFNLSNTPAFRNDEFMAVEVTPSGRVWFGSLTGLYYYHNGNFHLWTDASGQSIEDIQKFETDTKGRLWVKQKNDLYIVEDSNLIQFDTRGFQVYNILSGYENKIWVFSGEGVLLEIIDKEIVNTHKLDQLTTENISSLAENEKGDLYLGVPFTGLYIYKDGKAELVNKDFKGISPKNVILDVEGYLWAGLKGVVRFNEFGYETFSVKEGLTDQMVNKIFEDRSGNIWAGTKKGLNLFYRSSVKNIHPIQKNKIPKISVSTMAENNAGEVFVGTTGEGIYFYRDGQLIGPPNRMLAGQVIYGMASLGDKIAVSSNDGAFWISQKNDSLVINQQFSSQIVLNHFHTSDSTLWTNSRVNTSSPGLFYSKNGETVELESQRTDRVFWHYEYPGGEIMMGTMEGLLLWTGKELISISEELNLPVKRFSSHAYDKERQIHWLGVQSSGLIRYQNGQAVHFNTRNGFPTNNVRNLHLDQKGGIWVIGHDRAYYFKLEDLSAQIPQFIFTEERLIRSVSENAAPVSYQLKNGNILIANRQSMLELETDFSRPVETPLVIKTIVSDGDTIDHNEAFNITPFASRLSISYSGINFAKANELLIEYRLSGYEEIWNRSGFDRIASYTHLPAGNYQFELRLRNPDGSYKYLSKPLQFTKSQKWFYSRPAIFIYGVLFLFLVRAIILLRTKRIKDKNIALQKKVDERTEELRELNENLEQRVIERTHEITQVNKKLMASEQRYSYALDASNDGIWDWDVLTDTIKYSPAIYTMLGYEPYEFEESRAAIYALIISDDQKKWHIERHDALALEADDSTIHDEYRIHSKDGDLVWIQVKGKVVERTPDGRPKRMVGTHSDITAEKRKSQEILDAVLKTENTERKKIAKYIHDGLQQTLIVSSLNFQNVKKELVGLGSKAIEKFETGWKYLQNAIDESREVSHSLMPKEIIDYGIVAAIESLIRNIDSATEATAYTFQHNFEDSRIDSQQIEISLYRILQECTNNIIKYAKATRVDVQLREYDDIYMLSIEDNGIGFDVKEAISDNKGLGLQSIQNRIDAIGGHFEISSKPGKGTSIIIEINKLI